MKKLAITTFTTFLLGTNISFGEELQQKQDKLNYRNQICREVLRHYDYVTTRTIDGCLIYNYNCYTQGIGGISNLNKRINLIANIKLFDNKIYAGSSYDLGNDDSLQITISDEIKNAYYRITDIGINGLDGLDSVWTFDNNMNAWNEMKESREREKIYNNIIEAVSEEIIRKRSIKL